MRQWQKRVCLRVIRGAAAFRHVVAGGPEARHLPGNAIMPFGCKAQRFAFFYVHPQHVVTVHQNHHARAFDAAKPVVIAIDGGVERIVAPQRHHAEDRPQVALNIGVLAQAVWRDKVGSFGFGLPNSTPASLRGIGLHPRYCRSQIL